MQRKSLNKWRLLSGTILLTPLSAFASDSSSFNQFSPPEGDAAISFLHEVFGDLITAVSYGSQSISSVNADDVLGVMMSVFNASVLFLSMLFVTYTTIKGVVDSAHDAEILGKKMSSVWIPLRTAAGTGLLLPLSSGYSFIQVIIIWLGVHGVGIADKAWTAAIDNISVTGMFTRPYLPNARPLVLSILRSQVSMDRRYR
jgi:conjugal transfer/type IV secretion protein DotA/TraY